MTFLDLCRVSQTFREAQQSYMLTTIKLENYVPPQLKGAMCNLSFPGRQTRTLRVGVRYKGGVVDWHRTATLTTLSLLGSLSDDSLCNNILLHCHSYTRYKPASVLYAVQLCDHVPCSRAPRWTMRRGFMRLSLFPTRLTPQHLDYSSLFFLHSF